MKINPNEISGIIFKNNAKFIKDIENPEISEFSGFPKSVIENIKDYPESHIHKDKNWKLVDYTENIDGGGYMKFIRDDEKINTPELSISTLIFFDDEETFRLEKEQYSKGILKEISERTVERHISNNTFKETEIDKIIVTNRFGETVILKNLIEIKDSQIVLK
jgi:hypothetical protein